MAPILILACGNPSRGDDALGPLLIERLAERLPGLPEGTPGIELLTDFQLQVEHVLDLAGRERVVFADAATDGVEPFSFAPLTPEPLLSVTTHALAPGALLGLYGQVLGGEPPDCRVLAIRGCRFALGEGLSPKAAANLEAALARLLDWLALLRVSTD